MSYVTTPVEDLRQSDVVLVVLRGSERARSGIVVAPVADARLTIRADGRVLAVPLAQISFVKRRAW